MKAKDTLWRINWGDNDSAYIIAPDKKTAEERMEEGKEMVNYAVRMDALYQQIFKLGIQEAVEWIEKEFGYFTDGGLEKIIIDDGGYYGKEGSIKKYQAKLEEWREE